VLELRASKPSIAERFAARAAAWPAWRSPFGVLCRTFFAQFFASEAVTSDMRLRQAMVGVLAFLLMPGVMMMSGGARLLDLVEFRARLLHASGMLEPVLAYLASDLIMYSMVTVSFVAVLEWDALGFDRRDAMVLGPLPLRGSTIIGAKLAALGALLVAVAGSINLMPTVSFALATASLFGLIAFIRYLAAYIMATIGVAVFVFAATVTMRGAMTLVAGPRLALRLGSLLQFLFVGALLTFLLLLITARPGQARLMFFEAGAADWMPTGLFLALFEVVRGAAEPELAARAGRAVLATTTALAGAVLVSVAGFKRQSQLALAPSPSVGAFARVRVGRALVRLMTAGDPVAQATADFILLTLARCRAQQELIAINTAIGAAVVVAGLARGVHDLTSLTHPRTAVLWIPLVLAYSMVIGLRASFFAPSELRGSWTFRINGPGATTAYWSATRASMIVLVVPPTVLVAMAILVPLLGWSLAAIHTLGVCAIVTVLIEIVALTITFVPYTRPYPPGHANLKSLWWLYLLGLFPFAYWPARFALSSIRNPAALFEMTAALTVAIGALEITGRRTSTHGSPQGNDEQGDDPEAMTVLDIGTLVQRIHVES
jgi:hypothetical protein